MEQQLSHGQSLQWRFLCREEATGSQDLDCCSFSASALGGRGLHIPLSRRISEPSPGIQLETLRLLQEVKEPLGEMTLALSKEDSDLELIPQAQEPLTSPRTVEKDKERSVYPFLSPTLTPALPSFWVAQWPHRPGDTSGGTEPQFLSPGQTMARDASPCTALHATLARNKHCLEGSLA